MKKRFLALFLSLCMLLPCLPLATLGAEAGTGEEEKTVTVTFQKADGTEICKRENPAGYVWLMAPTKAEMIAAGMTEAEMAEIIGWYYMAPDGKYYDIGAYTSIRLEKDITISPYTKTSTFYLPARSNGAINAPLYTPGEAGATVPIDAWQGGFTVGYADRSDPLGTYTLFGEVDTGAGLLRKSGGYEWTQGGLYVNSGNVGFIQPNLTNGANGYTVLSWCALVAGTVNITIDIPAGDQVCLLVAKNGSIVYPAAGEGTTVSATDLATWYTKEGSTAVDDLIVATGLTVSAGDEIRFIMARGGNDTMSAVWPTITYTSDLSSPIFSDAIIYGGTTSFDTNKPTLNETEKTVTFNGGWDVVYYDSVSAIAAKQPQLLHTFSLVDSVYTNLSLEKNAEVNYSSVEAAVYFGTRAELGKTENSFAVMVQNSHVAGYRYQVEKSGSIRFDFTKLGRFSTQSSANAQISYAVYVDGVKVWPATATGDRIDANGWYTYTPVTLEDNDHTTAANALDTAARRGIQVKKGSTVEFLCTNTTGSIWGGSGNLLYADITYEKTVDGETSFYENRPTYDKENDTVTFAGGWSLVHYTNTNAISAGEANFLTKGIKINQEKDAVTIPAYAGLTTNDAPPVLATASISAANWSSTGANAYAIAVRAGNVGGYRYTAPYNGFIDIDFTKLGHFSTLNANAETCYAIYVDGVKVWPAGEAWYPLGDGSGKVTDITEEANAQDVSARRNLYVHKGSRVEILCTSAASIWGGSGNLMYASIRYHEVDPRLTVAATLGSALAMNVALGNTAAYRDVTVRLNGKDITADHGLFTLRDIAAREIEDTITYEVSGKLYGNSVVIAKGETSLADYLTCLVQDATQSDEVRMLAEATLEYGHAAKKHFENGSLTAAEQTQIAMAPVTTGTASRRENADTSKNLFTFSAASLLLNDEIDIKLYIDALGDIDSLAGYTIRVESDKVNGAGWTLQSRTGGTAQQLKAIVTGIPAVAYGTDLSITIMQGETAVSDTLIYSVDAYIARTYEAGSATEKNLLHAIARMGDVAGGAHIHVYGDWYLNGQNEAGQRLEARKCAICEEVESRTIEELTMVYQDTHSFSSPVLAITEEVVSSTDVLTGKADANVLTKTAEKIIYATGTGTALVKTEDGYYAVTVGAAPINMLFLSGQSNAAGGTADGTEYNENNKYRFSDYAAYYMRSPARMAYYTFTYQTLDPTADEASGCTPASYVVKTLKWGDNTRYSTVSNGPSVTTLCEENGTCSVTGVGAALSAEWIAQTGERVWLVNSAHGGHPIQNFLPEGTSGKGEVPEAKNNDYEQAVAVFNLALETLQNEIAAGHFSLSHMAFYWFQGESDSASNDLYYLEQFDRMYGELKKDVKLGERTLDFGGLFTVRSCKDNSGNSQAELYMTGPRLAQYEIGADNGAAHTYQNAYVVTNVTEQWTTTDEAVKEYFLGIYGSEENFKAIFGYDMPTTRAMLHPNIHYAVYGQNEMGMDAARNSLLILNLLGLSDYELPYAVQKADTAIRLLQMDGYTPLTEITIDATSGIGYVIPQVTPLYRVAAGLTLVSETEGYVFDQFRLSVAEGYVGTPADSITFRVMLGGEFLQRYTLPVRLSSSIALDHDLSYAQYGGDQNPSRENIVYATGTWKRGYLDYETGLCHPFDYYDVANSWNYVTGDTLWTQDFHGAYHASTGLAMSWATGSGVAVYCKVTKAGVVTPYFDALNTNLGDVDIAIMVNGYVVWPATAGSLNYDAHGGWYHAYNGDAEGETATTAATINEALASCQLQLAVGDVVTFVFERVDTVANITAMPGIAYLSGEASGAITVPQEPYTRPRETKTFTPTGFAPAAATGGWDCGYLQYASNTFTRFTVVDQYGWLHEEGEELWTGNWHGAFWHTSEYAIAVSSATGEDIGIRYTAEKAGTVVPQIDTLMLGSGDVSFAVYYKKAGETTYMPLYPSVTIGADGSGWTAIRSSMSNNEVADQLAAWNREMENASLTVASGDEILFLFSKNGTAQNTGIKLYPAVVYKTVEEA